MAKLNFYIKLLLITIFIIFLLIIGKFAIKFFIEKSKWQRFETKVVKVIDGDTIIIDKDNQTVRLLGIDAPETNHPDYPVQKLGVEAKKYLRQRIEFKKVKIEYNIENMYDKYGRLLAYVYFNGTLINAEMIKTGYAYIYTDINCSKTKEFKILESVARQFKKGVWKDR